MDAKHKQLVAWLQAEHARLEQEMIRLKADESDNDVRREGSPFGKREEEASETIELEKRMVLVTRTKNQMAEIEHALEKAKRNKYGLCDICNKPIELPRLVALPQAPLCLSCKAQAAKGRPSFI